ncbi:sortase [Chloroflexi bacterium TSY]|nr:sortase [Chloroflexi bacterium TSY]MBV7329350.1 sortase [Chloroflexi bacterium TSY]
MFSLTGCWWNDLFGNTSNLPTPPLRNPAIARPGARGLLPDKIEIPAIDLDTPVVELGWHPARNDDGAVFSEWDVADFAAGWHKNSALLGEGGNLVLSAHNNIKGAIFRELDQLKKGDEIAIWSGEHRVRYSVNQVMIVPEKYASPEQRAENLNWIQPFNDDRLTLVSCWPRNDNSHRIIVVARPTEDETASP